jgi:predicted transglutaminase-like cysteine proteinase
MKVFRATTLIVAAALGLFCTVRTGTAATSVSIDPVMLLSSAGLDLSRVNNWNATYRRHLASIADPNASCLNADCTDTWATALGRLATVDPSRLLREVNRYVNGARYVAEVGNGDRWETPVELFLQGGDCEDFAIAKFLLLRALGVSSDDMRILMLAATNSIGPHSVLLVRAGTETFVLDNRRANPYRYTQGTASNAAYAFNDRGMWLPLTNVITASR